MAYDQGMQPSSIWEQFLEADSKQMPLEVARFFDAMQADPQIADRFQELADQNSAGSLSERDLAEMWQIATSSQLLSILKLRARQALRRSGNLSGETP